jgi:hypothetical protein
MRTASRLLCGFALGLLLLAWCPALAAAPANYQGLWWNSPPESESGWGINLAHQGDTIFATWFTYDAAGHGWWVSMTAVKTAEGTYRGDLIESKGPAYLAEPFDPDKVTRTVVGSGTLAFRDPDNGTLSYSLKGVQQQKFITRLVFGPLPTCTYGAKPDFASATNYRDLWWAADGDESGWGINLEHQGDTIFATWFTYEGGAGTPLWLSVTAAKNGPNSYAGQLIRTTGPPYGAEPFDPAQVKRAVAGTASFTFANGNAAIFSYTLYGVSRSLVISRLLFVPPAGTRCGEPYRDPAPVSVVVAGDIAQCGEASAAVSGASRTAKLVGPGDAIVLTLGDNAYEAGTPDEFAACFHPTWGAFKDRIRPSPGNHDYYTTGAAGYFDYFGAQAGPDRRGYYSFDFAGWHFISLNPMLELGPQSEQYRWLLADLEASRSNLCTIAVLHYPAFNSGVVYGGVKEMKPVFETLYNAGVEMVLSGHEHLYERFAPQKADGTADPARGVRQFVVGTGGAALSSFDKPLPNSEFRYSASHGILRLALGPGTYGWQFVPVVGGIPIDAGSATCHR